MSEPLIQLRFTEDKVVIYQSLSNVVLPMQEAVSLARQVLAHDYRMRHMPAICILEDYDAYDKLISRLTPYDWASTSRDHFYLGYGTTTVLLITGERLLWSSLEYFLCLGYGAHDIRVDD